MQLHELKRKTPNKKKKIIGRGGTRGKTSGRGHKGQKARAGHRIRPEIRDIIKKLPKLRGRGVNLNTPIDEKPYPINLDILNKSFKDGGKVTPASIKDLGIIKTKKGVFPKIKILGTGEIDKKLTIADCLVSKTAKEKIEKAGGKVL